ncbi:MAG: Hpt domain-containing protein [Anaerolineae bacterium]|nr:Hpt domain-containing protein [Anaerolineae bacterium]
MSSGLIDMEIFNRFLESVNGDISFLDEMLETYFNDSPRQIDEMKTALKAANNDDLTRAAHSLKANSAVFGAGELANICRELEVTARNGIVNAADVVARIERIEEVYQKVMDALKNIRAGM